jgi:HD-like signal output (HDOD) protein
MPPPSSSSATTPKTQLLKLVTDSLRACTLELPSLPDIAINIRVAISQSDLKIDDLVNLIHQNLGLSTYLLKVSHSVH